MADKAFITSEILKWARESARISVEDAAKKVSVSPERYLTWEDGIDYPTIRQAKILAKSFRRPFSLFFLPEIPKDFQLLQDYRRDDAQKLDTASLFIIRDVQEKQNWISELYEEIDKNETITINAGQINEDAVYNWYDQEGNLIYTGTDLTVSPDVTKKYKLEIISNIDGFKDYDEVEITVNPYKLESLIPNPASQSFTVNYLTDGASSAYLMVVNLNTGGSDNYILDVQQSNTTIDISTYTSGLYNIILVCDGEVQNSKTLIKQ